MFAQSFSPAVPHQERQIKQAHSQALQKVTDERDSLSKTITGLQRKYVQMQHEVKRKELDLQKVSERLTDLLADKKKADAKAGVELERALNRSSAPSLSPSVSPQHPPGRSPKIDGDMFKMVVGAYEAKQKEMQEENKDLKASMAALQVLSAGHPLCALPWPMPTPPSPYFAPWKFPPFSFPGRFASSALSNLTSHPKPPPPNPPPLLVRPPPPPFRAPGSRSSLPGTGGAPGPRECQEHLHAAICSG